MFTAPTKSIIPMLTLASRCGTAGREREKRSIPRPDAKYERKTLAM